MTKFLLVYEKQFIKEIFMDRDKGFEQALFRFSLISPILHVDDERERRRIMHDIARRELDIPYSNKKKVTVKTLENYLQHYTENGFDGLKRQKRNDKDVLKKISDEVFDVIVALKKEEPRRSSRQIIRIIQAMPEHSEEPLKERTVSRILKKNGLTRKELKPKKIRRSFEMDTINDLWETDISDGLYLQRTNQKTYCFAFIDDHSRIIPHAQFYTNEKLPCLEDCLKKAILKRGIPKAIYADNGKVVRFVSSKLTHKVRG
jgi:putative transposase